MTLENSMGRRAPGVLSLVLGAVCGFSAAVADDQNPDTPSIHDVCDAGEGGAALYVNVENIRSIEGNIRVQAYGEKPEDFLEKGAWVVRVDIPVETEEAQSVCVQLPAPGTYSFVAMHDRNANGKADFFSEGFGFTNNPKLGLGPPDAEDVMFAVPAGVTKTTVTLKYILGDDSEKKQKRRKLRRR
jgi:uncharacterized protein (DUF2141 family)